MIIDILVSSIVVFFGYSLWKVRFECSCPMPFPCECSEEQLEKARKYRESK